MSRTMSSVRSAIAAEENDGVRDGEKGKSKVELYKSVCLISSALREKRLHADAYFLKKNFVSPFHLCGNCKHVLPLVHSSLIVYASPQESRIRVSR